MISLTYCETISKFKSIKMLFFCVLISFFGHGQQDSTERLIDAYELFTEAPREVAYAHLNKSTYVEGEMLGFTAYIFDKYSKTLSESATNLYCTISNENGDILRKKLLLVENGVASNVFNVDDSLSTGTYIFKAYTNWMKNFDENNHYEQPFKVIDSDDNQLIAPVKFSDLEVDLQVLGEGGHILYDVPNTVGIIAKNSLGFGIPEATGQITDQNGLVISEFQLNRYGIAKALFVPENSKQYKAQIFLDGKTISTPITNIKELGMAMTVKKIRDDMIVELLTNPASFNRFKGALFKAALHNGSELFLTEFSIQAQEAVLKFPKEQWFSGVNIITIFDENNRPILERLFFNKDGIQKLNTNIVSAKKGTDSLTLTLSLDGISPETLSNISVSVLPKNTKSYNHHQSIISQVFLRSYINGEVENASTYFKDDSKEADYNLDLVMLTQGWSSYNWDTIFNYGENVFIHPYERGIDAVANINNQQSGSYIAYPLERSSTQVFEISKDESQFTIKGLKPTKDDLFRIGYLANNDTNFNQKPSLYLQFYPNQFSYLNRSYQTINEVFTEDDISLNIPKIEESWNNQDVEKLEEVVVTAEKEKTRAEKLQAKAVTSKIRIVEERDTWGSMRLDLFLQQMGWVTQFDYFSGTLSILNPRRGRRVRVPLVYIDDALLNPDGGTRNFNILTFLTMEYIDYIEEDKSGVGGGIRGGGGFIKIYTDPNRKFVKKSDATVAYDIPLRFDGDKQFYTPKYQFYNSRFFNEYGTIDWVPNLNFNSSGTAQINILNPEGTPINLYIEGVSADGRFISEVKTISPN